MSVVMCPGCGSDVTLPFPWNFPTFPCPRCGHVVTGRRARALHLREFRVGVTAATAATVRRVVPLVSAARGRKLTRDEFFALAVAALAEKYGLRSPPGDETTAVSILETREHDRVEKETGAL